VSRDPTWIPTSLRPEEPALVAATAVEDPHVTDVFRRERSIATNAKVQSLARRQPLVDSRFGDADSLASRLIEDGHNGLLHGNDIGSEILEVDREAIPDRSHANRHVWILSQHGHRKTNQEQHRDRRTGNELHYLCFPGLFWGWGHLLPGPLSANPVLSIQPAHGKKYEDLALSLKPLIVATAIASHTMARSFKPALSNWRPAI